MKKQATILLMVILLTGFFHTGLRAGNGIYYKTTTTFVENADLVGDNEIDTGRFILLRYLQTYDVPRTIDEEHQQVICFKLRSLDKLPLNKEIALPDSSIVISSFFSSVWYYEEQKNITGTIKRIADRGNVQKIKIALQYKNGKGETKQLLRGSFSFKKDKDYFKKNARDYKGEYDNLRIALKEPEKVKKLDLTAGAAWNYHKYGLDSSLSPLPGEIETFTNLEELNLSLAGLKKLPPEIGKLRTLKGLDLSYNNFEDFPAEILPLENLDSLNFAYSRLTYIPAGISQLKNLEKLNLDYNLLTGFPAAVTSLGSLKELSVKGDSITVIPGEIKNMTQLEKLDMSSFWSYKGKNRPQNPEVLAGLKNLKELDMELDHLTSLPEEFAQLDKLEILTIKYNDFKEFPAVIDKIPNLKLLIISHGEFDENTMNELKLQKKTYKVQIDNL